MYANARNFPSSLNLYVFSLNLHVLHSLGFAEFGRLYSRTLLQGSGVGVHYYVLCSAKIDFIISICKEIALYGTFHVRRLKKCLLVFPLSPPFLNSRLFVSANLWHFSPSLPLHVVSTSYQDGPRAGRIVFAVPKGAVYVRAAFVTITTAAHRSNVATPVAAIPGELLG